MRNRTVRIYGRVLNSWYSERFDGRKILVQEEVAYREYDADTGELVATGSEDFSPERWHRQTRTAWLYTWDGSRRNAGGYRWFELQGTVKYLRSEARAVRAFLRTRYPDAAALELR